MFVLISCNQPETNPDEHSAVAPAALDTVASDTAQTQPKLSSDEQTRLEDEEEARQNVERFEVTAARFAAEPVDSTWADEQTQVLGAALNAALTQQPNTISVSGLTCRNRTCVVEATTSNNGAWDKLDRELTKAVQDYRLRRPKSKDFLITTGSRPNADGSGSTVYRMYFHYQNRPQP
jgi:hypothetical protein